MTDQARDRLLNLLARFSFDRNDEHPYELSSGSHSPVYINCKETTMRSEARVPLGRLAELLPDGVQAVGGLTMGSDPIAYAMAFHSSEVLRKPMDVFVVRKEPKKHGLRRWIEGPVGKGSRVAIVDDVVTTGNSTLQAIERCRDAGLEVAGVIVLVDRGKEDGDGLETIRREVGPSVPVTAVFTRCQVEERWHELKGDVPHSARAGSAAFPA